MGDKTMVDELGEVRPVLQPESVSDLPKGVTIVSFRYTHANYKTQSSDAPEGVYGLGSDSRMYFWSKEHAVWKLYWLEVEEQIEAVKTANAEPVPSIDVEI